MQLSYADILRRSVRLSTGEAVALALAAVRERDQLETDGIPGSADGWPNPEHIWLGSDGRVTLAGVGQPVADGDRVKQLSALVHALLAMDTASAGPRPHVPGSLLLLLARAAGHIDLPAPSYAAFIEALTRFGAAEPTALASLYWRCVGGQHVKEEPAGTHAAPVLPMPLRTGAAPPPPRRKERRTAGPSVAELRRFLRDTERELFALRQRYAATRSRLITLAYVAAASLLVIAGAIVTPTRDRPALPDAPGRPRDEAVGGPTAAAAEPRQDALSGRSAPPVPVPAPLAPELVLGSAMVADAFSPTYGHRGRDILFHVGRDASAVMRASFDERGQPRVATILRDGANNYHPALSPDGTWLAYDSDRDGTRGVYIAHTDGTNAQKVSGDGYAAVPRWSPDGRKLAFIKAGVDRPRVWNVWVRDLDARTLSQVSRHTVGQSWGASWFPDGERLLYSVEDTLVMVGLQSGTTRVLPSPRAGQLLRTPAVSPDGKWVVFQVYRDGVWLLEVSTGMMRRVLPDRTAEEFAWSPDSRQVVYHAKNQGAWSLWRLTLRPGVTG